MNLRQISSTDTVQKVVNDYNLNMQDIQANASLLMTSDPMAVADSMTSGQVKFFGTNGADIDGQYGVGIIFRRVNMRFILAITTTRIVTNYRNSDAGAWTGWMQA